MSQAVPRVLLIDENKDFGGAEKHVLTLASELQKLGVLEAVVSRRDSWLCQACGNTIPFHETNFRNEIDMFSVFGLYRKIKASGANILHCIAHRDLVAAALARQLPGSPKTVLLKAEHSFPDPKLTSLFRWSYRECQSIVAVSDVLRQTFKTQVTLSPNTEIEVVANGVDFPEPRPTDDSQDRPLRVGVLSALRDGKGHSDMLSAIRQLTDQLVRPVEWLFAGSGPLESALRAEAEELGVTIDFLGHCQDSHEFLNSLDLSVLPSHRETFSLVALETLVSGRPLIAADSEGVTEICGEHVKIYPKGDVAALSRAILEFCRQPQVYQEQALKEAPSYREKFSQTRMAESYLTLYKKLLTKTMGSSTS